MNRKIVALMGSLFVFPIFVEASAVARLLPVTISMRPTALALIPRTVQEVHSDVQKIREEKMKAMNTLFFELCYIQLGKCTCNQEELSDSDYYTAGVDWLEGQKDLSPDLVGRIFREHFAILKAFCEDSYSRDLVKEEAFIKSRVEEFVEKVLARVRE